MNEPKYQFFGVWGPTGEDLYVRTSAGASNGRADAEKDAALVYAYKKALSAVSHSRTIYEAEAYLQRLLDAATLAANKGD
jgi:hypothetical protein